MTETNTQVSGKLIPVALIKQIEQEKIKMLEDLNFHLEIVDKVSKLGLEDYCSSHIRLIEEIRGMLPTYDLYIKTSIDHNIKLADVSV